jgi:hypothetical protein
MSQRRDGTCCSCRGDVGGMVLLCLVVMALGCVPCWADTVVLRQLPEGVHDTQLLDALRNQSVSVILLSRDYAVGSQFDRYSGPPQEGIPYISVDR